MQQRGREERKKRFKVLTTEVMPLRLVSYPKEKAATDTQEVHGTTSGGYTSKVGDRDAGMEA